MPRWVESFGQATPKAGMAAAVAAVAVALLMRLALQPVLGNETPFILFFGAILFSAAYGGMRPGLVATGLAALATMFFFFSPAYSFVVSTPTQSVQLALFLLEGGAISYVAGAICSANNATRAAAERLRVTLRGIGDGVVVTDVDGCVVILNSVASELTGWPEESAQGRALEDVFVIVNERTRQPVQNPVRRVLRDGRIQGLGNHTILIARDGSERPLDDSAAPIRDLQGRLVGVVLVFRDITARRRAEAQQEALLHDAQQARTDLEAASRAKDNFLAVLSHELRSPLAAMSGWLQVLRQRHDEYTLRRGLETLERNVALQATLINELLDVSRIASGKLYLESARVDFAALVRECLDEHEPAMAAKSIMLARFIEHQHLVVLGDADRLRQVLGNLLTNATKFTAEAGRVDVTLAISAATAVLAVRDNGAGIAPDFLPHIFQRFSQDAAAPVRKYGGLGIGLWLVREIVRGHGGAVDAHSAGLGQGACFTVRLPLADAAGPANGQPAAIGRRDRPETRGAVRILIVEDDADTRESLHIWLEGEGFQVSEAASLEEAVAAYRRARPDVVVSDIGLPGADGYALIRALRDEDERAGRAPVLAIALSGFAARSDHEAALRAGFNEHLAKPVDLSELRQHIDVLLASRERD